MSKVRAPRVPKGESLKVTIGYQDQQIKLLVDRVEAVVGERDKIIAEIVKLREEHAVTTHHLAESHKIYERMKGWQDCAREIFGYLEKE